ncbi:acyl dehydratase [Spongisporangium articulatum]|uniref:Acyl dehydratase n=1 Tax=Spongisporangium articulatum TaxID=3362603 RepID=A0ABW8ATK2_9ACTN
MTAPGPEREREHVRVADLRPGDRLPVLTVTPGPEQLFFFSAAVYNGHRIHYDRGWAVDVEGHPGVLVQGALQTAWLARVVTDWAGPSARLVRFGSRNRGSAVAGETLTFSGAVTAVHHDGDRVVVDLELTGANAAGEVLMPGEATVSFPAAGTPRDQP